MKKTIRLTIAAVSGLAAFAACSHFGSLRAPSSYGGPATAVNPQTLAVLEEEAKMQGGKVHFPPGLSTDEIIDLWHMGEGSEVYPLAWFYRIKSQFSNQNGTRLHEHLDTKFGVIPETPAIAARSPYPVKYVGVTAGWSEEHPAQSDVKVAPGAGPEDAMGVRQLPSGRESVAMVGVNCAFCHSSEIRLNGKSKFFEGAPNMLAIRGFFQDLFASTAKTMMTPELLEQFLKDSNVPGDVHQQAIDFASSMKNDMGLNTLTQRVVGPVINFLDSEYYNQKKTTTLRHAMFEKRAVLEDYLAKLLKLTYGLKEVSPELRLRMKYLSASIGLDPGLPTTPEGFARTDAFGRISNLVARTKDPIALTATSSVPPMWNMEYRAFFHWNGNTNSVVMRNLGQSFGLGALLTNPNGKGLERFDATSNLHNLHKLESLLYKVQPPRWDDLSDQLDLDKVRAGCVTFNKTCAGCHTPYKDRVGPTQELVLHKIIPQSVVGTDDHYTKLQATPVEGKPFKDTLFGFTGGVRDRYYQRYSVSPETQAEWEHRRLRGAEVFRDTVLGQTGLTGVSSYMNIPADPTPGYPARQLGAVWATAPYLHNGSVPNLYELLKPAAQRPKIFFVGRREYDAKHLGYRSDFDSMPEIPDLEQRAQKLLTNKVGIITRIKGLRPTPPTDIWEAKIQVACSLYPERCFDTSQKGNSNAGHEGPKFGTNLSENEKYELIEFMKVLRSEPEYSRNANPIYRWNGSTCEILN